MKKKESKIIPFYNNENVSAKRILVFSCPTPEKEYDIKIDDVKILHEQSKKNIKPLENSNCKKKLKFE